MALVNELDSIDGLDPVIQKEYVKDEASGKYRLDHDQKDSIENMRRARDNEKSEHAKTKTKLQESSTKLESLSTEIEELKEKGTSPEDKRELARLQKEHAKEKDRLTKQNDGLKTSLTQVLADDRARAISSDLTDSPDILYPHLRSRFRVEIGDDGKPEVQVLDKKGEPSSMTFDELKKEFSEDKRFEKVVKGSSGAGGGGRQTSKSPSGKESGYDPKATPAEKAAWLRDNKRVRTE